MAQPPPDWADARQRAAVGALAEEGRAFRFHPLEYVGRHGRPLFWRITVRLLEPGGGYAELTDARLARPAAPLPPGFRAEVTTESGQAGGGAREVVPTYVAAGKNLGRANATNALTQALRDALGKLNAQRRRFGAPDVPLPMLVRRLGADAASRLGPADFAAGVTVQRKFNGVRCVAQLPAAGASARGFSRTGRAVAGSPHVWAEVAALAAALPAAEAAAGVAAGGPRPFLDGELYLHGRPLNWITGQAARADDEGRLEFHVFDLFYPDGSPDRGLASRARQALLAALFARADEAGVAHPHVVPVENFAARDAAELRALAARFLAEGYEGAIARRDGAAYEFSPNGYHSPGVLKIKPVHDDEFPVVGFTAGVGKDAGALVWVCEVPAALAVAGASRRFNLAPKGLTLAQRKELFRRLGERVDGGRQTRFERDVAGLPLTVEYAELSAKTGKPLRAKAVGFRAYEGDPAAAARLERAARESGVPLTGGAAGPGGAAADAADADPDADGFDADDADADADVFDADDFGAADPDDHGAGSSGASGSGSGEAATSP